jgi:hypothetical protein
MPSLELPQSNNRKPLPTRQMTANDHTPVDQPPDEEDRGILELAERICAAIEPTYPPPVAPEPEPSPGPVAGGRFLHVLVPSDAHERAHWAARYSRPRLTFKEYITRVMRAAEPIVDR